MKLHVGRNFFLPAEAVTQTFAILAKRNAGKTYTAKVLAEELLEAKQQIVAVDPIGVWWGLRAGAGQHAGYPVVVVGGDHGDVPLEPTAGKIMAEFVVATTQSVVLDVGRFRKADQKRFMTDFLEVLYYRNRDPLHVIIDEADSFAPQRPAKGSERLLGAVEDVWRRGRARGLGGSLITQRAAVLNKNVLTQTEVLVALQTTAPQDRKAIQEWVEANGTAEQWRELRDSLASLRQGVAWFWSPAWLDVFEKIQVRKLRTLDTSSTPKVGRRAAAPRKLAPVDLERLTGRIAETIERAKQSDPKHLRKKIADLERDLKEAQERAQVERVEVPILDDRLIKTLRTYVASLEHCAQEIAGAARLVAEKLNGHPSHAPPKSAPVMARPARPLPERHTEGEEEIRGARRRMLIALAQRPIGLTKRQLALRAQIAAKSSTLRNGLSNLRTRGYLDETGDRIRISEAGLAVLGGWEPLPEGGDLRDYWLSRLGSTALGRMFRVLLDAYPESLDQDTVASRADVSPTASTVRNGLSRLRTLELISGRRDGLRASEELFE